MQVGHIEDVCVDMTYRGKRLGQRWEALPVHASVAAVSLPSLSSVIYATVHLCDTGILLSRVIGFGNKSTLSVLCHLSTHAPDSGILLARVIDALVAHAKQAGCYKVILDCGEANVAFYEKCGLERKEVQMVGYSLLIYLAAVCDSRDQKSTAAQSSFGTVSAPALASSVSSINLTAYSYF